MHREDGGMKRLRPTSGLRFAARDRSSAFFAMPASFVSNNVCNPYYFNDSSMSRMSRSGNVHVARQYGSSIWRVRVPCGAAALQDFVRQIFERQMDRFGRPGGPTARIARRRPDYCRVHR
jgi:hypothetical protein